jgi:hypothetical protein
MVGFWHAFISKDGYLSQECIAKRKLQKTLNNFLWGVEVRTGVLVPALKLGISFCVFKPPYLEEK